MGGEQRDRVQYDVHWRAGVQVLELTKKGRPGLLERPTSRHPSTSVDLVSRDAGQPENLAYKLTIDEPGRYSRASGSFEGAAHLGFLSRFSSFSSSTWIDNVDLESRDGQS